MNMTQFAALLTGLIFSTATFASGDISHWGYAGHTGPSHWGDLNKDYHMCKDGKQQSPIDITSAKQSNLPAIRLSYNSSPVSIVNNGHTIQINMQQGSSISVGDKTYRLLQFHFHSPNEHTINGIPADMVAHFVHQAADGQLAVIGVLLNKGRANPLIAQLWQHIPAQTGDKHELSGNMSVAMMLPKDMSYYRYNGSLTTPPCSEGVNWMVLKNMGTLSPEQIKAFTDIFPVSVRPIQPMHNRSVMTR